eukprot:TRINITY_DN1220_c0_g1_i3.p1 TRINITY_DN1220_c0_g1~~TRINITY_DN1220_c0_g1_i3.p1  ORF type:complete len:180 (+),score=31.54 TRINITY_DN1220_c0_g1_i3:55-540(+)
MAGHPNRQPLFGTQAGPSSSSSRQLPLVIIADWLVHLCRTQFDSAAANVTAVNFVPAGTPPPSSTPRVHDDTQPATGKRHCLLRDDAHTPTLTSTECSPASPATTTTQSAPLLLLLPQVPPLDKVPVQRVRVRQTAPSSQVRRLRWATSFGFLSRRATPTS